MIRDGSVGVRRHAASQDLLAGQERYLPQRMPCRIGPLSCNRSKQSPFGPHCLKAREEALNLFPERDVIYEAVPVKKPRT
jgi:hypothetical protein